MADNFTRFSCVLDVGTSDNAARALNLYPAFMEKAGREGAFAGGFLVSIHPDGGGTRIWMRDESPAIPSRRSCSSSAAPKSSVSRADGACSGQTCVLSPR